MTDIEKFYCNTKCKHYNDCGFYSRNKVCEKAESFTDGYEYAIEKACNWLKDNISKETFIISDGNVSVNFKGVIEAFKKAMEEEL